MIATGAVIYGTGYFASTAVLDGASSTGHTITLTGLTSDTTYNYWVEGVINSHTGATFSYPLTFHTPKTTNISSVTSVITMTGSIQLADANATGAVWREGTGAVIHLQSITDSSTVVIPAGNTTVIA